MPFYLGENQYKIYLNKKLYKFAHFEPNFEIPDNVLKSSDKFYLKDINGVYLTALLNAITSLYTTDDKQLLGANDEILLVKGE